MFTRFYDMCSGGYRKVATCNVIYVEGNEEEATERFKMSFGMDPNNVTCQCCGPDYSAYECEEVPEEDYFNPECIVIPKNYSGE